MYCSNCGRQINNESRFCTYCGSEQNVISENKNISGRYEGEERTAYHNKRLSILEICIGVLYAVVGICWIGRCVAGWSETLEIYTLLNDACLIMMFVYIVPVVVVIGLCVIGILNLKKHKCHICIGAIIAVIGLIMQISYWISVYNALKPWHFTPCQISYVYGKIGIFTIIVCVIINFLVYKNKKR